MPTLRDDFPRLISELERHLGRPGRRADELSRFENLAMVYWERAASEEASRSILAILRENGLATPEVWDEADPTEVEDLLRQSGAKVSPKLVAPFIRLARGLTDHQGLWGDDPEDAESWSTDSLREVIAAIKGIGPAMADALLLQVFNRPRYPLDRATYRILLRHGWIDSTADYEEVVDLLVRNSGDDPNLLADLSVWFEGLGRSHCRASVPKCERCPLRPLLPEGGPLEGDS